MPLMEVIFKSRCHLVKARRAMSMKVRRATSMKMKRPRERAVPMKGIAIPMQVSSKFYS